MKSSIRCSSCLAEISGKDGSPCELCGAIGRTKSVQVREKFSMSDNAVVRRIREYIQKNKLLHFGTLVVTFGSPFLGLYYTGALGLIAGILFAAIAYVSGLHAVVVVREVSELKNSNNSLKGDGPDGPRP